DSDATLRKIAERSMGELCFQDSKARWAEASARSRSASVACGNWPSTSSVAGLMTSCVRRPSPARNSPSIYSANCSYIPEFLAKERGSKVPLSLNQLGRLCLVHCATTAGGQLRQVALVRTGPPGAACARRLRAPKISGTHRGRPALPRGHNTCTAAHQMIGHQDLHVARGRGRIDSFPDLSLLICTVFAGWSCGPSGQLAVAGEASAGFQPRV